MILSRQNLSAVSSPSVEVPPDSVFNLPEKVVQFGTGVLLRGLPDYFINKANTKGIFNGRVIVVKSTDSGDTTVFEKQDGLFTLCIRGQENGILIKENSINASISRVLSAKTQWNTVLQAAHLSHIKIIISNTTEVGIQLVNESIHQQPPLSFPAKLLAFLYERYKAFNGTAETGMVIIPTELIVDNGKKLESIVLELARFNKLEGPFMIWLKSNNHFCNSLVDRIVPGTPDSMEKKQLETKFGYTDDLLIIAEAYRLWAIEGNERIRSILSFADADKGVVITPDINLFRELKLRMLNGTHTLCCGIAFLSGFETVKQAMDSNWMSDFVQHIMMNEIAPAIPYEVSKNDTDNFGKSVLDRFRNEAIRHHWINITLQFSSKLRMRVVPVVQRYYQIFQSPPICIAAGFAAWFLFMRSVKKENNNYYGRFQDAFYPVIDDSAGILYNYWNKHPDLPVLRNILCDETLWGCNLDALPGFTGSITEKLKQMMDIGVAKTIQFIQSNNVTA